MWPEIQLAGTLYDTAERAAHFSIGARLRSASYRGEFLQADPLGCVRGVLKL